MTRKPILLILVILFLLSACSGGTAAPKNTPSAPATEPYPAGGYPPAEQPVNPDGYPAPGTIVTPMDFSAYPAPNEPGMYDPQAGDANLERAEITVDFANSDVLLMESFPVQAVAKLTLQLPTPCHLPRVKVTPPDDKKNITLEVYAVVDPTVICTQVISTIEVRVSLGTLQPGTYHVIINGEAFKDVKVD